MKKLIALTLMVACLACFTLGCPSSSDTKPTPPAPTGSGGGETPTPGADVTPASSTSATEASE